MHSLGNDFMIVLNNNFLPNKKTINLLANRKTAVGFDQLIVIKNNDNGKHCLVDIYNADGSQPETCGNGFRCVAFLIMQKFQTNSITISSAMHTAFCKKTSTGILVNMGQPKILWHEIPLREKHNTAKLPIKIKGLGQPMCINIGNTHTVFFVDKNHKPTANEMHHIGPYIEQHNLFPLGTNVHIACTLDNDTIAALTWERGSGLTNACGSGACAIGYLAYKNLNYSNKINIKFINNIMNVLISEDNTVSCNAPASMSFFGSIDCTNDMLKSNRFEGSMYSSNT
ncbi:diaminopimelate epimerase [Candidatus Xenohaliotis californiensis]